MHALHLLHPRPEDLLLIHYSAYAPRLEPMLELPNRKMLVYHNVTPARYLWSFQPHVAALCEIGRDHLPRYAQAVDVAVAVSEYNARRAARGRRARRARRADPVRRRACSAHPSRARTPTGRSC